MSSRPASCVGIPVGIAVSILLLSLPVLAEPDNITGMSASNLNKSDSNLNKNANAIEKNSKSKKKKKKTEDELKKEDPHKNRPAVKLPQNLIRLPLTRQATNYTCGVSALQSVLAYYGEEYSEMPLSKKLRANYKNGTAYMEIKGFSEKNGFQVDIHKNMAIADLKALIDKKFPVICLLQAWSEVPVNYSTEWNDGHYVVAVGYDEKNIFFMDPSTLGTFAYVPENEFIERWHDTDGKERLHHFGMVVSKDKVTYQSDVATFME